jgi:aminopeptidase-like protein
MDNYISDIHFENIEEKMYLWAGDLFPLNRSITGQANRETLKYLKDLMPNLEIKNFKSGEKVFDWIIPDEWEIDEGYIEDEFGNKIIDFKDNNLHVIGYSEPVDTWLTLDELNKHLYSIPEQPNAIPYLTSYYKKKWGFCITDEQRLKLNNIKYHVYIKSKFFKGQLDYGELLIEGQQKNEILLSTYICHPSMGNNELSGIVVTAALAQLISSKKENKYSYRILFIPETIGSIAYLSVHSKYLQNYVKAGFVITCVGDNHNYSFLPSRTGNTYADKVAKYAIDNYVERYNKYSFLERGSDERQFCSPLINLPVVSIMRSKYGTYPEYHTSLDNLDFISKQGLLGSFSIYKKIMYILENNIIYEPLIPCEPQLGKRGLYNITSNQNADSIVNILAYIDGEIDLLDLCNIINIDFYECVRIVNILLDNQLIQIKSDS